MLSLKIQQFARPSSARLSRPFPAAREGIAVATSRRLAVLILLVSSSLVTICANAQVAPRIRGAVDPSQMVVLAHTAPHQLRGAVDLGPLAPGSSLGQLVLALTPDAAQEAEFESVIEQMHLPSSPLYHKWLTPKQVGERYGVAEQDAAQISQWLEASGLKVERVADSRRFILFSGTAGNVARAFGTEMRRYRGPSGEFIANATDLHIPAALERVVGGVVRLHSTPKRPNAHIVGPVPIDPVTKQISFSTGFHLLTPGDFSILYDLGPLWQAGIDGTGQSIAIVARSNIDIANVRDFRASFMPKYTGNDPVVLVNGADPGDVGGDDFETMLDVTWSGAVAPRATIKVVVSESIITDGVDVSAGYIVDTNLAPVMSTSYGSCEDDMGAAGVNYYGSLWKQAAAQGITAIVSSGDAGGAGCDNPNDGIPALNGPGVNGLASTPYNVAVGGTQFDEGTNPNTYWGFVSSVDGTSVKSYIPEKVWNESSVDVNNVAIWAGGGGKSNVWAKPSWQIGTGVPPDGQRDIPDVSLSAALHDGYVVCFGRSCNSGSLYYVGGTSASAPAFAGMMALVNQKTNSIQGNANYVLYPLAAQAPSAFHDIVNGDNLVPAFQAPSVGYPATPGYDLASGLGSIDAAAMVNNWAKITLSASSTAISTSQAGQVTHGTAIPINVAVTSAGGTPSGTVTFFADSQPIGAATILAADGTASASVKTIPAGTHNVTARYSGDGKFLASTSAPLSLTVTKEASKLLFLTSSFFSTTQATYGEPVLIGAAVRPASGAGFPSGSVDFLVNGSKVGTGPLDFGDASGSSTAITFPAAFAVGNYNLSATYAGDSNFNGSVSVNVPFVVTKSDSLTSFSLVGQAVANLAVPFSGRVILSGGSAPITGTITIQDVTQSTPVSLGSAKVAANGAFSGSLTFASTTPALVLASYSGDGNINASQLLRSVVPVAKGTTTTKLTTSSSSVTAGASVVFTAAVTSTVASKAPTGTVTFLDGSTSLGTANVDAIGIAAFTTTSLGGGVHSITASYGGDSTFNTSTSTAVTQTVADYALQAAPSSITVKAGSSVAVAFVVQPQGGYKQAVTLACSGLPTNMGCSFSPSSVTPDGVNAATTTLTISTDGSVHAQNRLPSHRNSILFAMYSSLALGLVMIPAVSRRRVWIALSIMAVLFVVGLAGCGGSSSTSSTKPTTNTSFVTAGTYTVNVTATAGGVSHQTTLSVNVTP